MWMSEPGGAPDARDMRDMRDMRDARPVESAPDERAGWDGQRAWNGAPDAQPVSPPMGSPQAPFSGLAETQPRLATPPPHRAAAPRGRDMDAGDGEDTRKRRRVTDSARMPALRLNRRDREPRAEPKPRMVYETDRAPGYLRLARLMAGLVALAAAWGMALAVSYLGEALWVAASHQPVLSERFALYLMAGVGILWLALIGLALIVVGAFSLFLALTRRSW